MAVAKAVADALAADPRFGPFGGSDDWSVYVGTMPAEPARVVAVYDKPNVDEGAAKESGKVRIVVRGPYADATAKLDAAVAILSDQPLGGWLAWTQSGVEALGEDDRRWHQVATELTFKELCDTVTVRRMRRERTDLSYRTVVTASADNVPALVQIDTGQRETYRGARVQSAPVTAYLKTGNVLRPGDRGEIVYKGDRIDIDSIVAQGAGCARNVLVLTGTRRVAV